jgi:hypothetical protein
MTVDRPFDYIYQNIGASFQYAPAALLETDHVYQRRTQEYCLRGGHASGETPI